MPKIKTCRAAAKRFKKTGTGKIMRNKAYKSHILTKKSQKRKRKLSQANLVDYTNRKNIQNALPYIYLTGSGRYQKTNRRKYKKWQELKAD